MGKDVDMEYEKQKIMIESLINSPDLFALCSNIINHKYFAPELRNTVKFVLEYYEKYNNTPKPKIILAETGVKLDEVERVGVDEFDYAACEIEKFCKEQAVIQEVVGAGKFIEKGDYGSLIERIEKAVLISLQRDMGTNLFENVQERIEKRNEERKPISTGMPNVDKVLGGGLNRTELMMASANSGGGKSIFLSNLSLNFAAQGHDVLYISLELNEDMVADRFETMITGWSKTEKFERSSEAASKVQKFHADGGGRIFIKYMEAESNANDIKAYLKEFELQYKCVPTLLVVDYLDIFGTNERQVFGNVYEKDKVSSTQLRAIGNNPHYNMVMATASQQNRSAINETDMTQGHIAGGLSKVNIVDVYFSIIMTDAMRAEGVADFAFLKTRSSGGVGKVAHMRWDPIKLTFTSLDEGDMDKPNPIAAKIATLKVDKDPIEGDAAGLLDLMDMDDD